MATAIRFISGSPMKATRIHSVAISAVAKRHRFGGVFVQHFHKSAPAAKVLHKSVQASIPTPRHKFTFLNGSSTIYKVESTPDPDDKSRLPTYSDFDHLITTPGMIAADKSRYIAELDEDPQYQYMFLRPRRWGKSTFLQMLANYYDKGKAAEFDTTFGQLCIGKNPTRDRNSLLVLLFDFSSVRTFTSLQKTETQMDTMICLVLQEFLITNRRFLGEPDLDLITGDGGDSLQSVLNLVRRCGHKLFVGVDEYDAPANARLFSSDASDFPAIADLFKTRFFAIIKRAAGSVVQKYWLTGVLPAFRDGISPLTATKLISSSRKYSNACGLTEEEVHTIAKTYLGSKLSEDELNQELQIIQRWYNGYQFCKNNASTSSLYNPQQVFTHLKAIYEEDYVNPHDEVNTTHTASVLNAISTDGEMNMNDLLPILDGRVKVSIMPEFGAPEVQRIGRDARITWSFLYYYGVITHGKNGSLTVPNSTNYYLITRRFRELLKHIDPPFTEQMTESCTAFTNGDPKPLVRVLQKFFQSLSICALLDSSEANLRSLVDLCWFEDRRCLSELCLVKDSEKMYDQGRYGFINLFLVSSSNSPDCAIELKNITLSSIFNASVDSEPTHAARESLRQRLMEETPEELLRREYCYWDQESKSYVKKLIRTLQQEAVDQVNRYLQIAKLGPAKGGSKGIHDKRIRFHAGTHSLQGYVVMCIGGTRILTWTTGCEEIPFVTERYNHV